MKKLSLFSLFWLLAFVAMPIYAEDVYFDENYIVIPGESIVENLDDEDVVADEEAAVDEVEEIVNEIDNVELAVEEELTEDVADLDVIPELDLSDFDGITSSVSLGSSSSANILARVFWVLWSIYWLILGYAIIAYFALCPISKWEIYRKAGKKGWAFLVPIWGTMVRSEIAGMSKWLWLLPWLWVLCSYLVWILPMNVYSTLLLIFGVLTLRWVIVTNYRIASRYGWNIFASILHALIIFCPITLLVLGLGNYRYQSKSESVVED